MGRGGFSAEMDPRLGGELAAPCGGDTGNERLRQRDEERQMERQAEVQAVIGRDGQS